VLKGLGLLVRRGSTCVNAAVGPAFGCVRAHKPGESGSIGRGNAAMLVRKAKE